MYTHNKEAFPCVDLGQSLTLNWFGAIFSNLLCDDLHMDSFFNCHITTVTTHTKRYIRKSSSYLTFLSGKYFSL